MKKGFIYSISVSSLMVLLLSGCSSISGLTSSSFWQDDNTEDQPKVYGQQDKISTVEAARLNAELSQRLDKTEDELSSLRADVNKVIALESDLSFIVDQFSNVNTETYSLPINQPNISLLPAYASKEEAAKLDSIKDSLVDESDNTLVSPALALNSSLLDTGVNDLKFSGTSLQSNDAEFNKDSEENKFSTQRTIATDDSQAQCQINMLVSADTNKFGLHIASYTNLQNVKPGLDKLVNTHPIVLCGKGPLLKDTIVNNKKYVSLRFGPFNSLTEANKACGLIQAKNQYCKVIDFDGKSIK